MTGKAEEPAGARMEGCLYSVATFANLTGAPISALNHAAQLGGHFASVRLVLPGTGDLLARAEAAGVPAQVVAVENRGLRKRLLRRTLLRDLGAAIGSRWGYFATLRREFRKGPGIVHVHDRTTIAPLALLAARCGGLPSVLHVRYPARTLGERLQVGLLSALADAAVFVSDGVRRGYGGWIRGKVRVIHNFMALPPVAAVGGRRRPRIAMVSQMSPAKGTDLFLGACARLRAGGEEFGAWMVGRWGGAAEKAKAEEYIRDHDLAGAVEIRDQETEMGRVYGEMDVLVLPTRRDAFPRVVMEAMCHGVPVVATRIDGVPEMVADGETGYLVDPEDEAGFAEAVARLLRDEGLRRRMGAAGRERAREIFSPEAYERATMELYREIGGRG